LTDITSGPGASFAGTGIVFAGTPSFDITLGGGPAGSGGLSQILGLILGGTGPSTSPAGRRMAGAEAGFAMPGSATPAHTPTKPTGGGGGFGLHIPVNPSGGGEGGSTSTSIGTFAGGEPEGGPGSQPGGGTHPGGGYGGDFGSGVCSAGLTSGCFQPGGGKAGGAGCITEPLPPAGVHGSVDEAAGVDIGFGGIIGGIPGGRSSGPG